MRKMTPTNYLSISCILVLTIFHQSMADSRCLRNTGGIRAKSSSQNNLKYVLYWTPYKVAPFYFWGKGQENFIKMNCPVNKCYMTTDRSFCGGDLTKFDAIAFNGRNVVPNDLPRHRSEHQKYLFINMECPIRFPTCPAIFDGFYNWTSTYRLDSDIPYPYIIIRDKKTKEIVGPKANMQWTALLDLDDDFDNKIRNKTKLVAWFVSNCRTPSKREEYARALQTALHPFGHTVDIYGKCGPLECPRMETSYCNAMLARDYYFYLSFENSFDKDYVTEKLNTALNNNVVPVVYGGANYSRFLPPGSYIDAREYSPTELAALLDEIVQSPQRYRNFFKWQTKYEYSDPTMSVNICNICAALNDQSKMMSKTVHNHIREWLLGDNLQNICHLK